MTYGIKSDNKMPPGRKPFGMTTNITGRSFDGHGPKLPNDTGQGYAGSRERTIRPHKHADGQDADGTPAEHVHGKISTGYNDSAARKYRAELRGHTSKKGHSNHG